MKLLFDQNLSPKLVGDLADSFPGSCHVQDLGLACADDERVWEYAGSHGFVIVTKDADYNHLSIIRGSPPKVLWLQLGNCSTAQVATALRTQSADVIAAEHDPAIGTLIVKRAHR